MLKVTVFKNTAGERPFFGILVQKVKIDRYFCALVLHVLHLVLHVLRLVLHVLRLVLHMVQRQAFVMSDEVPSFKFSSKHFENPRCHNNFSSKL